jgi:hypothetical protein
MEEEILVVGGFDREDAVEKLRDTGFYSVPMLAENFRQKLVNESKSKLDGVPNHYEEIGVNRVKFERTELAK